MAALSAHDTAMGERIADVVDEVASQTLDLPGLAGLCIGMDTMLSTDRVSLH